MSPRSSCTGTPPIYFFVMACLLVTPGRAQPLPTVVNVTTLLDASTGQPLALNEPGDLSFDPWGNLIVANTYDDTIVNLSKPVLGANGVFSATARVVAGQVGDRAGSIVNGVGTAASFNLPTSLAINSSGFVFVADGVGSISNIRSILRLLLAQL